MEKKFNEIKRPDLKKAALEHFMQDNRRRRLMRDGESKIDEREYHVSEDKDALYEGLVAKRGLNLVETAVVDDRVIRGIAWGNRNGATTVWFQNGKFGEELPNTETGDPTHLITEFIQLKNIFL